MRSPDGGTGESQPVCSPVVSSPLLHHLHVSRSDAGAGETKSEQITQSQPLS